MNKTIISIVTPSYNQGQFISNTLESVLTQKGSFYLDFIVIDGGSNDETLKIIQNYAQKVYSKRDVFSFNDIPFYESDTCLGVSFRWISEKDNGQASAINKGFGLAVGDIFAWLNSDDLYYEAGTLNKICKTFSSIENIQFIYGKGVIIDRNGIQTRVYKSTSRYSVDDLEEIDFIMQPAAFWKREIYETVGLLDERYNYVLDWDYWLRIKKRFNFHFLDEFLACNRVYSDTKTQSGGMARYVEILKFLAEKGRITEKALLENVLKPESARQVSSYKSKSFFSRVVSLLRKAG